MTTVKKFKWWWGWNSEKVENWLEEQEANGLRLDKVSLFGTRFHFVENASQKVRYSIDYQPKIDKDYINLIHDDGWELIPVGAGWYVCRKEYEHERPHLYSDYDSLIDRNKKLLSLLIACSLPAFAVWPTVIENQNDFFTVLLLLLILFYLFSFTKLMSSNKLLQKKKEINGR